MRFERKDFLGSETLGEKLKRLREERGATEEDAASFLHISTEYVVSLETGQYQRLPGPPYVSRYVAKYAEFLQVNPKILLSLLQKEFFIWSEPQPRRTRSHFLKKPLVVERYILGILLMLLLMGLGVYLFSEVMGMYKPPFLEVDLPPLSETQESPILLRGRTEKEAFVFMNGEFVEVGSDGSFDARVPLQEGLNTLTIEARKKFSRERVLIREIVKNE